MGIDGTVYAGQRVLTKLPAGVGIFPPLDFMSPPLDLVQIPLEISPFETVQPASAWAPLEVVESGLYKFCVGVCIL